MDEQTPESLIALAADTIGVTQEELVSRKRTWRLSLARQIVMWHLYHNLNMTLAEVGKAVGGRSHCVVIHGMKVVEHVRTLSPHTPDGGLWHLLHERLS